MNLGEDPWTGGYTDAAGDAGYMIALRRGLATWDPARFMGFLAHELEHVAQAVEAGGWRPFLVDYWRDRRRRGYKQTRYEVAARAAELRIMRATGRLYQQEGVAADHFFFQVLAKRP